MTFDPDPSMQQFYMEQLMDNYKNPQNFRKLKDYTFLRHQKNAACGDFYTIYVKVIKDKISDATFTGEGCAISMASFSLLSQKLKGMKLTDAKKLTDKDIYEMLGIKISPARVNCAMLSLNAFTEATKEK